MMAFLFDRWAGLPPNAPWWHAALYGGLLLLLLGGAILRAALRQHHLDRLGHLPQLERMMASRSRSLGVLRPVLVGAALLALGVVVLGPQVGGKARLVKERGVDLVIVLDYSKSMYATDVPPSRVKRAKQELRRLLERIPGTRVGLVLFAGSVKELPMTTDYDAVRLFWEDLTPNDMPVGGTAIGRALTSAVRLLQRVRGKGAPRDQAILLITDGEDQQSDPLKAADMAKKLGIRIYTLGIGTRVPEPIPVMSDDGRQVGFLKYKGKYVTTKLDSTVLREIAKRTSGKFIEATPASFGVDRFVKALGTLRQAETKRRIQRSFEDWYALPLFVAFLLFWLEASLGSRRFGLRRRHARRPKRGAALREASPSGERSVE